MLLDRLESGFLLFETPQGMVRAELSLRQRVRLLWTFRHFRQLSIPLLNERERALVNALFQHNAGVVSLRDHGLPVIGIVENFVPPLVQIDTQPEAHADLPSESSPVLKPIQQEPAEEQTLVATAADLQVRAMALFMAAEEAVRVDLSSAAPKGAIDPVEPAISLKRYPDTNRSFSAACEVAARRLGRQLEAFKFATSTHATIAAVLSIVVIAAVALRGVLETPALQAHAPASVQSYTANLPSGSLVVVKPTAIAESRASLSTPAVSVQSSVEHGTVLPAEAAPAHSLHNSAPGQSSQREQRAAAVGLRPAGTGQSPVTTRLRGRRVASTPNTALASQENGIQATRPPVHFVYPVYRDVNVRGKVALTARVEADGTVRSVRVVSGNRALSAAAVRAVRVWRYRPYVVDGQPVVTDTNIVFSFFADDAISMTYPPSLPSIQ
jgi:TonB family protein